MKTPAFSNKATHSFGVILAAVLLAGCLMSEYDEYHIIINTDGKSGTITTTMYNLESDQSDTVKQREDFETLLQNWKGDQYLLEKMKEGVYVKDRKLTAEKGGLVWKEVAIFADIPQLFHDVIVNDTLRIGFGNDETVVATNGELIRTKDSSFVQWPLQAKEFFLKTKKNDFHATSHFAARYEAYIKDHHE